MAPGCDVLQWLNPGPHLDEQNQTVAALCSLQELDDEFMVVWDGYSARNPRDSCAIPMWRNAPAGDTFPIYVGLRVGILCIKPVEAEQGLKLGSSRWTEWIRCRYAGPQNEDWFTVFFFRASPDLATSL